MRHWEGRRRPQDGFTLVELMVVVLIMAILLAIAIPTYLGARHRAENRAAQTNLRTADSALITYFSNNQGSFSGVDAQSMSTVEPGLSWTDRLANVGQVATGSNNNGLGDNAAIAVSLSAAGKCFWIMQVETPTSRMIKSSLFNSETVTSPGTWYAQASPGGPNGSCELGLNSPPSWSQSTSVGW